MNPYIKTLIEANKDAVENISVLEDTITEYPVTDEKSKTNFGNLCILLNGYRNIAKATECLLINEQVLKGGNGYYQKIDIEEEVPTDNVDKGKPSKE